MKVICIDAKRRCDARNHHLNLIKEGEIYNVIREDDESFYLFLFQLKEIGYLKARFIPLSDIDEMELVNQREEYA